MNASRGEGMSLYDVAGCMLRRWYVTLILILLAVGGWVMMSRDSGIFTTNTVMVFTRHSEAALLPDSGLLDENLIAFAGLVANEMNAGRPAPRYAYRDAPLYGAGVREGMIVGLPDSGGQWTTSFTQATIEIQIVGRTESDVRERQTAAIEKVFDINESQQVTAPVERRVSVVVMPLTTEIDEITPTRSGRIAAAGSLSLAVLLLAGGTSVLLDRRLMPRLRAHSNRTYGRKADA